MKKIVKILALALVLVFTIALVACGANSYGKLEKAFAKEGYVVDTKMDTVAVAVQSELAKEDIEVEVHTLKIAEDNNGIVNYDFVVIVEFKNVDAIAEACEKSTTLKGMNIKGAYDSLVEAGWANGNCLVFSVNPLSRATVKKIVKAA